VWGTVVNVLSENVLIGVSSIVLVRLAELRLRETGRGVDGTSVAGGESTAGSDGGVVFISSGMVFRTAR
jgi:hypothetical protein